MNRPPLFLYSCLCFGFAFFYVPIISMIVFSFTIRKYSAPHGSHWKSPWSAPLSPPFSAPWPA